MFYFPISWRLRPGGNDCVNLSAFSESVTQRVYKYLLQRILNLVTSVVFLILTDLASLRRAFCKKSRISWICLGYNHKQILENIPIQTTQASYSHSPAPCALSAAPPKTCPNPGAENAKIAKLVTQSQPRTKSAGSEEGPHCRKRMGASG